MSDLISRADAIEAVENNMNVPFTGTCVRYKGKWYWWDSTICDVLGEYGEQYGAEPIDKYIEVIAWMPLPKPYKGGDTE